MLGETEGCAQTQTPKQQPPKQQPPNKQNPQQKKKTTNKNPGGVPPSGPTAAWSNKKPHRVGVPQPKKKKTNKNPGGVPPSGPTAPWINKKPHRVGVPQPKKKKTTNPPRRRRQPPLPHSRSYSTIPCDRKVIGATGVLIRSTLGDLRHPPLWASGSIDFVCITEGYRLMDWFLLFYRALVEEYFVPVCKAGDMSLMNFNSFCRLPRTSSDTFPEVIPRHHSDRDWSNQWKRHLVVNQDW